MQSALPFCGISVIRLMTTDGRAPVAQCADMQAVGMADLRNDGLRYGAIGRMEALRMHAPRPLGCAATDQPERGSLPFEGPGVGEFRP
jgi:hypothetical protein